MLGILLLRISLLIPRFLINNGCLFFVNVKGDFIFSGQPLAAVKTQKPPLEYSVIWVNKVRI